MSHRHFSKRSAGWLSACAAGIALSAHAQMDTFGGDPGTNALVRIPADTDDWTRHFRIGAMVGLNLKAKFSMSGSSFGISGSNPSAGNFDDGYVHPDQTGDPAYTSNWGYDKASQLSASGNTLSLHSSSSFSTSGSSSADSGLSAGVDLAYGGNLWYWRHARVGWDLGLGWLPIDITDSSTLAATVTQSTYNFNVGNITVPANPYQGTPSGVGPLIPLSGSTNAPPSTSSGIVSGTHELDVNLFTLRLGPSMYWDLTRQLSMSIGAGPAVGLVEGDYKYSEIVTANGITALNSGKISGAGVVFGGYVTAALMYHVQKNGDIYFGAQYMPMTDASISGGGRKGELDLNGQVYLSLGINWPF